MKYHHLTIEERSQIYGLLSNGFSLRAIATSLKRSSSTVSREINRNRGGRGYRTQQAHSFAFERRQNANLGFRKLTPDLVKLVDSKLRLRWSPEQISGWLLLNKSISISHERLYQHVWANKAAGGTLFKYLRHRGKKYHYKGRHTAGRGCIPNRVDISQRPPIVELKSRVGDWEVDTIIGKAHKGAIVSMVDRKTKFVLLAKVASKTAHNVSLAILELLREIPSRLIKTLTFDNGKEFSYHQLISQLTGAKSYFATPYCSWERGLNEHTNGLVRQYVPKSTFFNAVSRAKVKNIQDALNNRPRKVLAFLTPNQVMQSYLKCQ